MLWNILQLRPLYYSPDYRVALGTALTVAAAAGGARTVDSIITEEMSLSTVALRYVMKHAPLTASSQRRRRFLATSSEPRR